MAIQEVWMLLLALGAAGSVAPWCEDTAAPPVPGMYGPMGVELTGPRGSLNQYVDLPPDRELVALFAQGLAQLYGFNNFEALRNFNRTAQISPTCALCHWGIAMSYGPNINSLVQRQDELNLAANAALALSHQQPGLLPKTRDMISSIGCLIQPASHVDSPSSPARRCMARLLSRFSAASPDDDDLAAFSASALMSLSPWDYYNATPSYGPQPLKEFLIPARDNLVRVSNKTGQPHALAIHLMIHLMEPSNAPPSYRWQALQAASRLSSTVPSQGHLTHMPAHLFLRTGWYARGVRTSQRTATNNQRYLSRCLVPYGYGHNLKMLVAHARMAGMSHAALHAASLATAPSAAMERSVGSPICVDCAGPGSPEVVLTLLRFGLFEQVLGEPLPHEWGVSAPYNKAGWHYARAVALYALGEMTSAAAESMMATEAAVTDKTYREIVPHELEAARAWYQDRDSAAASRALEAAREADDSNPYMEPPRWYYPIRQCLGWLYLDAGNASRAVEVFEEDLGCFPENSWSLAGMASGMEAMGRVAVAEEYRERAAVAWQDADMMFRSPCLQLASGEGGRTVDTL